MEISTIDPPGPPYDYVGRIEMISPWDNGGPLVYFHQDKKPLNRFGEIWRVLRYGTRKYDTLSLDHRMALQLRKELIKVIADGTLRPSLLNTADDADGS